MSVLQYLRGEKRPAPAPRVSVADLLLKQDIIDKTPAIGIMTGALGGDTMAPVVNDNSGVQDVLDLYTPPPPPPTPMPPPPPPGRPPAAPLQLDPTTAPIDENTSPGVAPAEADGVLSLPGTVPRGGLRADQAPAPADDDGVPGFVDLSIKAWQKSMMEYESTARLKKSAEFEKRYGDLTADGRVRNPYADSESDSTDQIEAFAMVDKLRGVENSGIEFNEAFKKQYNDLGQELADRGLIGVAAEFTGGIASSFTSAEGLIINLATGGPGGPIVKSFFEAFKLGIKPLAAAVGKEFALGAAAGTADLVERQKSLQQLGVNLTGGDYITNFFASAAASVLFRGAFEGLGAITNKTAPGYDESQQVLAAMLKTKTLQGLDKALDDGINGPLVAAGHKPIPLEQLNQIYNNAIDIAARDLENANRFNLGGYGEDILGTMKEMTKNIWPLSKDTIGAFNHAIQNRQALATGEKPLGIAQVADGYSFKAPINDQGIPIWPSMDSKIPFDDIQAIGVKSQAVIEQSTAAQKSPLPAWLIGDDVDQSSTFVIDIAGAANIKLDPKQFQTRAFVDSTGVGNTLKDQKRWDNNVAGIVYLYAKNNGDVFVVDGHHRVERFKYFAENQPKNVTKNNQLLARVWRESDYTPEQATKKAAIINIKQSKGDANSVGDAANFARLSDAKEYASLQTEFGGKTWWWQVAGLKGLSDENWGAFLNKVAPANQMAILGQTIPAVDAESALRQNKALVYLVKLKPSSLEKAKSIIGDMKHAKIETITNPSLFGAEATIIDGMEIRMNLRTDLRKFLNSTKKLYESFAENSEVVKEIEGNEVDVVNTKSAADNLATAQIMVDKLIDNPGNGLSQQIVASADNVMEKTQTYKASLSELQKYIVENAENLKNVALGYKQAVDAPPPPVISDSMADMLKTTIDNGLEKTDGQSNDVLVAVHNKIEQLNEKAMANPAAAKEVIEMIDNVNGDLFLKKALTTCGIGKKK